MLNRILICAGLILATGWVQARPVESKERPLVLASASMFADMASNIAGDLVEVRTIVPVGQDPHTYEPTPADAQWVSRAQLILVNGLTFEGWLREVIANAGGAATVVTITEGLSVLESESYANSADPHAWMSAANGLVYLDNILAALCKLAPEHAEEFRFNHGIYRQQLQDLDAEIFKLMQEIPQEQRVLITSHDAFRYFGKRYGVQVEAALGTSTEADVQTSDVRRLTDILQHSTVPAVFIESTVNPKLIRQLAQDNGVVIGGQLYADSLGEPGSPGETYLGMLQHNARTIHAGLIRSRADVSPTHDHAHGGGESALQGWLLAGIVAFMLGGFAYTVYKVNQGTIA